MGLNIAPTQIYTSNKLFPVPQLGAENAVLNVVLNKKQATIWEGIYPKLRFAKKSARTIACFPPGTIQQMPYWEVMEKTLRD